MKIEEAKGLKREVEIRVTKMFQDFETATGCQIHSIDIQTVKDVRMKSKIVFVGIEATI